MFRAVHISWIVTAVSAGLIVGVGLALVVSPMLFAGWEWLVLALALFVFAAFMRTRWMLVVAAMAGCLAGLWIGSLKQLEYARYTPYINEVVTLQGTVAEDTAFGPEGDQRLRLNNILLHGQEFAGAVWVSAATDASIKRGDVVTLRGRLSEGFGNMPASMFRAQLVDVYRPQPGDIARQVRDWFADKVRMAVDEPQASLGLGYLVGQRSALPDTLESEFRTLGLIHLVVASGSNLIIIVQLLKRHMLRISKFTATSLAFLFIFGFLAITGFSTSMTRAALVAGLSLLAWHYGRSIHPIVLLFVGAAVTLLLDPSFLWGDMGWYLSFAAFAGVVLLAPLLNRYFWGDSDPGFLRYIFTATLSAQLMTLPVIAFTFGEYSPLAIVANLLIQPLVPVAMTLVFIAGIAAMLVPALAAFIGWPAQIVLGFMTGATSWLAGTPFAHGEVAVGAPVMVAMYAGVVGLILFLWWRTGHDFRQNNVVE